MKQSYQFDIIFDAYDYKNQGKVSLKDFLNVIDDLQASQNSNEFPLLNERQRAISKDFIQQNEQLYVTKSEFKDFVYKLTGNNSAVFGPPNLQLDNESYEISELSSIRGSPDSPSPMPSGMHINMYNGRPMDLANSLPHSQRQDLFQTPPRRNILAQSTPLPNLHLPQASSTNNGSAELRLKEVQEELNMITKERDRWRNELVHKENELALTENTYKSTLKELHEASNVAKGLTAKVRVQTNQLQQQATQLRALKEQLETSHLENKEVYEQYEILKKEQELLRQDLADATKRLSHEESKCQKLQRTLKECTLDEEVFRRIQDEKQDLQEAIQAFTDELHTERLKRQALEQEIAQLHHPRSEKHQITEPVVQLSIPSLSSQETPKHLTVYMQQQDLFIRELQEKLSELKCQQATKSPSTSKSVPDEVIIINNLLSKELSDQHVLIEKLTETLNRLKDEKDEELEENTTSSIIEDTSLHFIEDTVTAVTAAVNDQFDSDEPNPFVEKKIEKEEPLPIPASISQQAPSPHIVIEAPTLLQKAVYLYSYLLYVTEPQLHLYILYFFVVTFLFLVRMAYSNDYSLSANDNSLIQPS
ncbi:meiotic spindle pole body protein Kms1 [Schizosaccharomyces japonicus yFS275]|uniref:Meiotic spindle pole body protein Kms1 n=1 Tax=Schizosaccharomyces japonicus (strain yFS275 / FY16936) TaxID=402676 RepID=B6JY79_SCHJY|nr:meiotic spindle pole body protein Kms1 [Schizosaccharomyces japonicus yFS275]EEB06497.1 meiotic spindle pole body protein Kms1 [Schizosaccharomyces japonicus yFS275]